MRVSREEKERSRRRIVAAATRRFRGRGIAGTSVAEVMADAELTHGGFYRHFDSKDDLLVAALDAAFSDLLTPLENATTATAHQEALRRFVSRYLSDAHAAARADGCPIAALATEIPKESDAVQVAFAAGVTRTLRALQGATAPASEPDREAAMALLAQLVGAVVLARASESSVAGDLLRAVRGATLGRPQQA